VSRKEGLLNLRIAAHHGGVGGSGEELSDDNRERQRKRGAEAEFLLTGKGNYEPSKGSSG